MGSLFTILMVMLIASNVSAHDLSLVYSKKLKPMHVKIIDSAMSEVALLLPQKIKDSLPKKIEISVAVLSKHKSLPIDLCEPQEDKKTSSFVYAKYDSVKNNLMINLPVYLELAKGRSASLTINCQHKNLYDQAIGTIIHELTHAYDYKNGRISNKSEYLRVAGFKKGVLKIKNKNVEAMRSADRYELKNTAESFAVNMEYFTMDPEFKCRRPSMFKYFESLLEVDPFPNRNCQSNNAILVSTPNGLVLNKLEASRVYRIDYLLASPGNGPSSGFGHSMFRLIVCAPERVDFLSGQKIAATAFGKKCLEDKLFHLVVSYRANVEDAKLNYVKGLTGGYPSMLFILNFADVLDEYNADELRDVVSYPMDLSSLEIQDFVTKVIEDHWNYRGDYKFITNNCAVESYDLLQSSSERSDLDKLNSLTPRGVLEDLERLKIVSRKDKNIEAFPAKSDSVILSYHLAYGYKLKKDEKKNIEAVQKFISKSSVMQRSAIFSRFLESKMPVNELNTELALLKERMAQTASYSVMEQQILRSKTSELKKEVAEMLADDKNEKMQKLVKEAKGELKGPVLGNVHGGYGIPLMSEIIVKDLSETHNNKQALEKLEEELKILLNTQFMNLEAIKKNISHFNRESLNIRREFRKKLETYVLQVLKNLSKEEFTRKILIEAAEGNLDAVTKVRELLGADLVTKKEILDQQLQKMIKEL